VTPFIMVTPGIDTNAGPTATALVSQTYGHVHSIKLFSRVPICSRIAGYPKERALGK